MASLDGLSQSLTTFVQEARHPKENFDEDKMQAAFVSAKEETAKRRDGKQQGKLDYKQGKDKGSSSSSGAKKGVSDDVAALLAAGLSGHK
ncbi:hypothetical protein THRCLA_22711 [Thraustotheca clavata]|uniref:Uncharacterized protein n=1 Tax=Thraustotheca clavata TaxID=74557 RepID=A0A1V9YU37_9STRA|nr:hypothetical protein THRCLA_22711 [Thraustotheca clavata]